MKARDLHLLELLEVDGDEGALRFKDRRMLLWDADAFGALRAELIETLGSDQARPILKRFGFANGYRDALMTEKLIRWESDEEWWRACPSLQRHEGKVRPTVQRIEVDRSTGKFHMEVEWNYSYEAEQHLHAQGKSLEPVCWTLAGAASGFASALMNEECIIVETECVAMGAPCCRVVGKTRKEWAADGDRFAADYRALPLSNELQARARESLRQQEVAKRNGQNGRPKKRASAEGSNGYATRSKEMERILNLCETVARVDSPALLGGETGVGKKRLARHIHQSSRRRDAPFTVIHCGALPEAVLEGELFGHDENSFHAASTGKVGLLQRPAAGTVYLDEIGAMSSALQVKLLRALQDGEVWPVGAHEPHPMTTRLLASSSRNLKAEAEEGNFRSDLLYRLSVLHVEIPALRNRPEDILPLARLCIQQSCVRNNASAKTLSAEAAEALVNHSWPGNVHELENAMDRAVLLTGAADKIEREELPPAIRSVSATLGRVQKEDVMPMAELERRYVIEVLERYEGNRTRTAKALGIGANTLWRKLKGWGVPPARGEIQ
jgi:DNA-binding NtrC family response regulator